MIEILPPAEIAEIIEKARSLVGNENVTYHWQVFPETNRDKARRVELVLSLFAK